MVLSLYISFSALKAVVPADLWTSLSTHVSSDSLPAGVNLSTVLNNWVEESGHPVVTATRTGDDVVFSQVNIKTYIMK